MENLDQVVSNLRAGCDYRLENGRLERQFDFDDLVKEDVVAILQKKFEGKGSWCLGDLMFTIEHPPQTMKMYDRGKK